MNIQPTISYESLPLFSDITLPETNELLHCLKSYRRKYKANEIVILNDEEVPYFGIILSGRVHMVKEDFWGNETMLAYLGAGELIGETFAFQKVTNSHVSFITGSPTEVLFISSYHIMHNCERNCSFHNQVVQNMFHLLCIKNLRLMEKIEITSKTTLREKILTFLSIQAQKQDSRYITIPLSRAEMAKYLCTNRSSMTRELSAMRDEGLIDFDKNTFVIC